MTLTGTNSYVVGSAKGEVAVIDPGPDEPRHLAAILAAAAPLGSITSVLVTHRHLDHLPAAKPLCAQTGAVLVGHADLPGVQRPVADGQMAFGSLIALETPGHTRESLCFWDASAGTLFSGDLIAGSGTVVVDDQPRALADYLGSLERLLVLAPRTIYPGHGPVVEDGLAKVRDYLDHRRQRVDQVVEALGRLDGATVDQLVGEIYPGLTTNLVPMAARNVRANLELLAGQGRATPSTGGNGWRLRAASGGV